MESHVSIGAMTAILPLTPFPPLHWWHLATGGHGGTFQYEANGAFQKQTLRNRMILSGPQGKIALTFPVKARDNGKRTRDVLLYPQFAPVHSFRTLKSAYGGAPFFEHFADELLALWHEYLPATPENTDADPKTLHAFNGASIDWVAKTCGWTLQPDHLPTRAFEKNRFDLRDKQVLAGKGWEFERYTQLFEPTNGFIPRCSILDSLMTIGPAAVHEQIHQLVREASDTH